MIYLKICFQLLNPASPYSNFSNEKGKKQKGTPEVHNKETVTLDAQFTYGALQTNALKFQWNITNNVHI